MSKFDRLFQVAKDESAEFVADSEVKPNKPAPTGYSSPQPVKKTGGKTAKLVAVAPEDVTERAKVSGKRQHPDFVGLTTYIRKDVHRKVKIALLVEGDNRELSELVDELLATWLKKKGN